MRKLIAAVILAACLAPAHAADKHFSRQELLVTTKPMGETYAKLLKAHARDTSTSRRIERVFAHVLEHAKRLRPDAARWDWQLVLVAKDVVPPFALPDGQIFVSPKWVASRRLGDPEIALMLAHEMAHVISEHMLERVSAFAAARPAYNLRVWDALRTVEDEWYLARELEPVIQAQELEADRIGMTVVCEAGVPRAHALGLFDKLARPDTGTSYLERHDDPLRRRVIVPEWARAQNLVCLD